MIWKNSFKSPVLSNNNPSFNPSGVANNNASQSQFVLKGSDLVLATQRANNNLNIRRGY